MSELEHASIGPDPVNRDREGAGAITPPAGSTSHPLPDGRGSPGKGRGLLVAGIALLLALIVAVLWFAFSGNREPGDDLARLQGVWKVTAYGRETQASIRVDGDRWTYSAGGMEGHSYRLTLRPDANPKEIDLVLLDNAGQPVAFTHGAKKGSPVSFRGVYSIKDETLRVVLAPGMEPRPTAIDGDGSMTLTRTTK